MRSSGSGELTLRPRPRNRRWGGVSLGRGWVTLCVWALVLGSGMVGCLREEPPPTDPELARQLGLSESTPIHRVVLASREGRLRVLPGFRSIRPGDWVQFVAADRQVYAVRFRLDEMDAAQRAYLSSSAQEASPPLTTEGARFVIGFEGAPQGLYSYWVDGYGATVEGAIRVEGHPR